MNATTAPPPDPILARRLAVCFRRRRRLGGNISLDELAAVALVALWEAAGKYDPERGIPFAPWASRLAGWRMSEYVQRAFGRNWRRLPRPATFTFSAQRIILRDLPAPEEDPPYEGAPLDALLAPLDWRARDFMRSIYRDGLTQRDAGVLAGLSPSGACRMHQQALALLRDRLTTTENLAS